MAGKVDAVYPKVCFFSQNPLTMYPFCGKVVIEIERGGNGTLNPTHSVVPSPLWCL